MAIVCKVGDGGGVVFGSCLGCDVDDGEDGVAARGERNGQAVEQQRRSSKLLDARPIDKLRKIFLSIDQRIIVLFEFDLVSDSPRLPGWGALMAQALR